LFILDRNFGTRNGRKPIKVSKDVDFSLVSREILPSNGWAQVRYQQPKMAGNLHYLWCHSQKNETQHQKVFFHCRLEDLPSLSNSSLAQSVGELCGW